MNNYLRSIINWLIINTFIYGSYYYLNLGSRLTDLIQSEELGKISFLSPRPLLRLYLFSSLAILILGIVDLRRQIKDKRQNQEQKEKEQRRHYTA